MKQTVSCRIESGKHENRNGAGRKKRNVQEEQQVPQRLLEMEQDMIEELYTAYYEELRRYLVNHIYDYAAAEDITQEAFLRAMEHEGALERLDGKQRRAWLYRTAKNILIDRIRHQNREPEWEEAAAFEEDLTEIEVQLLVGVLSERDRAIFQLRYFEGYRAAEIAEIFQMKPDNVRARLSLTRKILKQELEGRKNGKRRE